MKQKAMIICLLVYVAAFICFAPVAVAAPDPTRDAIRQMVAKLLIHVGADNSVSESAIDDALVHIHERIDAIISDVLPKDADTRDSFLEEPNKNMSSDQLSFARSYHHNAFDGLKRLFDDITRFMKESVCRNVRQLLQAAQELVAPPLKWHFDQEEKYRPYIRHNGRMMKPKLPKYKWEDVDPQPSRLEQEVRNARLRYPASRPVTLFMNDQVDRWIRKIQELQRECQAQIDDMRLPRDRRFHGATARNILRNEHFRREYLESTAAWRSPYDYKALQQLPLESSFWVPLYQAHEQLILLRANYDLERVKAYKAYKPNKRQVEVATIIEELERFISAKRGDTNIAQTSVVPECSNVNDVGTSTPLGEQTKPAPPSSSPALPVYCGTFDDALDFGYGAINAPTYVSETQGALPAPPSSSPALPFYSGTFDDALDFGYGAINAPTYVSETQGALPAPPSSSPALPFYSGTFDDALDFGYDATAAATYVSETQRPLVSWRNYIGNQNDDGPDFGYAPSYQTGSTALLSDIYTHTDFLQYEPELGRHTRDQVGPSGGSTSYPDSRNKQHNAGYDIGD
ncbi:hypothetical protein SeLEV6574_g08368 [Synchytrium endobioticum]|uniref:Uncharacterized protein n=1 Tax=Synchytrium endobioticum TaxID=286115 RepID=A0A507C2H0_9FUNG|nr:hypothetical protein SeLEV6574_g08368 [Synchytrium endobioticum]